MLLPTRIALASILVATSVFALKAFAYVLTGSVAFLSDALESTTNLVAALATLAAIRIAARPADARHPYGHHKAEFFSALLEGVLIIVAALFILNAAITGLRSPEIPEMTALGVAFNLAATVLNAVWANLLVRKGKALRSPALVADGKHLYTDVVTSAGVVAGVALATLTGWWILDPLIAAVVGLHILWMGAGLIKGALSGLMDEALPEDMREQILAAIQREATGAIEAHDLRTRHAGTAIFVDFHLIVPGQTSVFDAHEICDRIEAAIQAIVSEAQVTIHVEPEHMSKSQGLRLSR